MFKLSQDNDNDSTSSDLGAVVLEKEPEVNEPPSYQVVLINDDYTPMEFVVYVIQKFFGYDHAKSTEIMLEIHNKGRGFCGAFSQEIAETKSQQINQFSKENEHPLKSDIEELGKD